MGSRSHMGKRPLWGFYYSLITVEFSYWFVVENIFNSCKKEFKMCPFG